MKKFLKRRLLHIPVWLIILLASFGLVLGAATWISNMIHTQVIVSDVPIRISGDFNQQEYIGIQSSTDFIYTSTAIAPNTGYINIALTGTGTWSELSDSPVTMFITPNGGESIQLDFAVTPSVSENQIILWYGSAGSTPTSPLPISFGNAGGTIKFNITYDDLATIGTVHCYMQVSSTIS